jgi:hypothetical protein
MELSELFLRCKNVEKLMVKKKGLLIGLSDITVLSELYRQIEVILVGDDRRSEIFGCPDYTNRAENINRSSGTGIVLNISVTNLVDKEEFIFIIGHEFGHIQEKAIQIYDQNEKNRNTVYSYYRNQRFTEVEQSADTFAMEVYRNVFRCEFPVEKFIKSLAYNDPKETKERINNLYPNYRF